MKILEWLTQLFASDWVRGSVTGVLIAAFVQWVAHRFRSREERHRRISDYLRRQLEELYGPLHFFMSQNGKLLEQCDRSREAYRESFEGRNWPSESDEIVHRRANATIEYGNAYIERVRENNAQIMQLLKNKWYLIDIEDIEVFSTLQFNFTRGEMEFQKSLSENIPPNVRMSLGMPIISDSGWGQHVERIWREKRKQLSKYLSG